MKNRKRNSLLLTFLSVLLLSFTFSGPVQAEAPELSVKAAILVDAETGKILYAKNADKSLGVASMTKMMTEYLLFEAIEEGRISWDQQYKVTEFVRAVSVAPGLANVPLRLGETYSVKELYEAMAIYSANAATIALAEVLADSEGEFVKMMNAKADELQLEGTEFVNSTGLSNSDMLGNPPEGTEPDGENTMTARSVAKLAKRLLEDYPEVLETAKLPQKTFRPETGETVVMKNWNFMLKGLEHEYEGMDGLKTGTTNFAGYCFTGTAERNGRRLIVVVMDAVDASGTGSYKARFDAASKLLNYGFNEFSMEELVPAGYQFPSQETVAVEKGKQKQVGVTVVEPIQFLVETADKETYQPRLVMNDSITEEGVLEAPVKKGQSVGAVEIVKTAGVDFGFLDGSSVSADAVTTEKVKRASWFALTMRSSVDFISAAKLNVEKLMHDLL